MGNRMSPGQERVYALLYQYRQTGRMPPLSDVARQLGIHYVSLRQHLLALARDGHITFESRGRGRPPHVEITGMGDTEFAEFAAGYRAGGQAAMRSAERRANRRRGKARG